MIAENKQPVQDELPKTLTYRELFKCFYMILKVCGGKMTITKNVLDNNITDDVLDKIGVDYIESVNAYRVFIKKPVSKGIITLKKRIITPN